MRKEKNKTHNTKYNRGITLIALIITIVVLLILAIVSIGAINDSNIIKHSQTASRKYTIAQEQDTLQLALSEWQLQKNIKDNPKTFKQTIKDALVGEAEVGEEDPDAGPLTVTFNKTGNKYKVYDDGTITKIDPNSSEPEDIESPEDVKTLADLIEPTNYGDTIEYSANGIDDWKIFYNDGENVFIITSDCIPYDKIPSEIGAISYNETDMIYWTGLDEMTMNNFDTTVSQKFMAQWSKYIGDATDEQIDIGGVKVATKLIDHNLWESFISDIIRNEVDAMAIGSPTAEMWGASWNDTHDEKIECLTYGEYYTECGGNETEKASINYILFPVKRTESGLVSVYGFGIDKLFGLSNNYFMSSPGYAVEYEGNCLVTYVANYVSGYNTFTPMELKSSKSSGLRPVVCLPSNAIAEQDESGSWTNLKLLEK